MKRKERYDIILEHFRHKMPKVTTELEFGTAFQLLVATLLSAQCTDVRINKVTPALFGRFPDASEMAKADVDEIYSYISSVSYPNAKAQHLKQLAEQLVNEHHGEVPSEREALESLAGVGRKTANVVLSVWFGKPAIAVDTHVFRVSHRLGLVPKAADTPLKVETELMRHIKPEEVGNAHHWLLLHGRYICQSRRPKCGECPFAEFCPGIMKND